MASSRPVQSSIPTVGAWMLSSRNSSSMRATLAEEAGFELADLQFDDDEAQLPQVERDHVGDEDLISDVEAGLTSDEGQAVSEGGEGLLQALREGLLEGFPAGAIGQGEVVEDVGAAGELLSEFGVWGGELGGRGRSMIS
jgi:hypothetical protein